MKFIADFHVHSKYSRATAKNSDIEHLYMAARKKGLNVVGTGDFTHPGWFSEIEAKLVPAEAGLFKLKDEIEASLEARIPDACRGRVRFILTSEISNIYKKNGKTRKNHNLIFSPDLTIARAFNAELDTIGNIHSDGRPILGLDAKHLLEIMLETSEQNFLVPAHIWTPWFSLLGSKSGFDSVEACFEDLTPHIFAVETGLSSDPAMNWRVAFLDGLTLISNSDAHSPDKLGREANMFDTDLSFDGIRRALESGRSKGFLGTLEFYPEEGKYHLDGHRKCGIRSHPTATLAKDGICPVCQKPMTLGVLYRVEALADRAEGAAPSTGHVYKNIIPLKEILSEILGVGPNTKKVDYHYQRLLHRLGPELDIVNNLPLGQIDAIDLPHLSEAVGRVRDKKLNIKAGYDGEFGKIEIFSREERDAFFGQKALFFMPVEKPVVDQGAEEKTTVTHKEKKTKAESSKRSPLLNRCQREAVEHTTGAMIIVAGPGTGKTLTITHKIAHLIRSGLVEPRHILALTFTNKAADEMRQRLERLLNDNGAFPLATTFHGFCVRMLSQREAYRSFRVIDENERRYFLDRAIRKTMRSGSRAGFDAAAVLDRIIDEKQKVINPLLCPDDIRETGERTFQVVYDCYQTMLSREGLWDYEDLLMHAVTGLEQDPLLRERVREQYRYVFVDEYQDVNDAQYRIIRQLSPPHSNITVIGDPDQSIYGFRGSDATYFHRFSKDYPGARTVSLSQNYRSAKVVLKASQQLLHVAGSTDTVFSEIDGPEQIEILPCSDEKGEAIAIGREIERMVGGVGFYSLDFEKTDRYATAADDAFGDFAVLLRTARQSDIFAETFKRAGIPYQVVSKNEAYAERCNLLLVSFMKIISGSGSYMDMERAVTYCDSGLGTKPVSAWLDWSFENNFSLEESLNNVRRFPLDQVSNERQRKLIQSLDKLEKMRAGAAGMDVRNAVDYILENTTVRERTVKSDVSRDALRRFKEQSRRFGSMEAFCMASTLNADADVYDERAEKVTLMTMHASKGLEFPVVFIGGCENGLIPFAHSKEREIDEDEERRLLYVAMTRAKRALFLSYARRRRVFGKKIDREPSFFLKDIRQGLKNYRKTDDNSYRKKGHIQLDLF